MDVNGHVYGKKKKKFPFIEILIGEENITFLLVT